MLLFLALLSPILAELCSVPANVPDAGPYIQNCLDAAPVNGVVSLPPGVHNIGTGLHIDKSVTLNTQAAPGPCSPGATFCATLRATANLYQIGGIVRVTASSAVILNYIIIDGNRAARLQSQAARECAASVNNRYAGINGNFENCADCAFTNSVTMNSLCASGMVVVGPRFVATYSTINNNGDHHTKNMWSDGMTVLNSPGVYINGCQFTDNSDVDLILGTGPATITNNWVRHSGCCPSFAAMMFDNFDGTAPGNFLNSVITANHILCNGLCCFGIEAGPHPWYPSQNILGGNITNNEISGAGVLINVDGAGTAQYPLYLGDNRLSAPLPSFSCLPLCGTTQPGSALNISPESVVKGAGAAGATNRKYCVP
jgi:hypothetical protein